MGVTVAPTALRESRAHSSTMRTLGLGRARHSSARTLTTDRAPLSRPPPTSVESDPRLNWLWAQVHRFAPSSSRTASSRGTTSGSTHHGLRPLRSCPCSSSRRPPRWTCSSAVWAAASNCYTTLPSSPATAFERGLIAIGTEPRAPRTSHLPSSAPS